MSTLLESLLHGEFKFGFELEAYSNMKDFKLSTLHNVFAKYFGENISIIDDNSLQSSSKSFEFPTPVMQFTPMNIKNCITFLEDIQKEPALVYTDGSCGFHVHFSFSTMDVKDMVWILCNVAENESLTKEFTSFDTQYGQHFDFTNFYAKADVLKEINKYLKEGKFEEISKLLTNDKYRTLRLHPQGTIEWRGPRDFMDDHNIDAIRDFFIKFYKIITKIIEIMDKKEIAGISKDNFFQLVNISNISSKDSNTKNDIRFDFTKIIKNPLILTKLKKLDINYFVQNLLKTLEENNIKLDSFLIPLRYKRFENQTLVRRLVNADNNFINYLDTYNLQQLVKVMDGTEWLPYLKMKYIRPEVLEAGILSSLSNVFLIDGIQYRLENDLSLKSFTNPIVLKAIKSKSPKQLIDYLSASKQVYPYYVKYYDNFIKLLS
jgi:hypothetical protein